jgi:hypothetical protein
MTAKSSMDVDIDVYDLCYPSPLLRGGEIEIRLPVPPERLARYADCRSIEKVALHIHLVVRHSHNVLLLSELSHFRVVDNECSMNKMMVATLQVEQIQKEERLERLQAYRDACLLLKTTNGIKKTTTVPK